MRSIIQKTVAATHYILTVYMTVRERCDLLRNRLCFLKLHLCRLLFSGVKHQSTSKQCLQSWLHNWVCWVCGSSTSVLPIDWKWASVWGCTGWFDGASGSTRCELDSVSKCKAGTELRRHLTKFLSCLGSDRITVISRDMPQVIER